MNIGTLLPRHARYRADHLAVVCEDERLTFADLAARVNRLVNALARLGMRTGDAIAVVTPNRLEVLEVYWAAAQLGLVLVPLSPLLRGPGLLTLLRDSDAAAVVAGRELVAELDRIRDELACVPADRWITFGGEATGWRDYGALVLAERTTAPPAVDFAGDHPFNIIYSSGTTGVPKGIIHTHDIRANYCTQFASTYRMTPESVVLHAGSLVFNGAFVTLMPALFLGATYVLQRRFEPEAFIAAIERERATHVMMVPSQIIAMMNAPGFRPERLRSLEMLCTVGAPFHVEHKARLTSALPGIFYELYGLTEGVITILDREDYAKKPTSVGCSQPFFEMRIVGEDGRDLPPGEVGEIIGRSPILMPGYHKRPDLTAQAIVDGWMHTGDMGFLDEDGYLHLVDRMKDLIISGGMNVYPRDIEEVIVQHPAVAEAAVFGVPDEKWGEVPLAAVVLKPGERIAPDALRAWVNERVGARFQQVRAIVLKDEFPRNAAGKTLKREMREPYWSDRTVRI